MSLRERIADEICAANHGEAGVMDAADRILSLLQADVVRREREAFCEGADFGREVICRPIYSNDDSAEMVAKTEAARRYPEGRQQHGK